MRKTCLCVVCVCLSLWAAETAAPWGLNWLGSSYERDDGGVRVEDDSTEGEFTHETQDGMVWWHYLGTDTYKGTVEDSDLYDVLSTQLFMMEKYDASYYDGATVTESAGKCGNVNCTVYTINGKATTYGDVYQDYDLYVYDGYVLKENGVCNGANESSSLSIFVAA